MLQLCFSSHHTKHGACLNHEEPKARCSSGYRHHHQPITKQQPVVVMRNDSILQCAGGEEEPVGQSHIHCKHQAGKQAGGQACKGVRRAR